MSMPSSQATKLGTPENKLSSQRTRNPQEEEDAIPTALNEEIIERSRKRIEGNIRMNKIEIQRMHLVVSRDANWDGLGLPPTHKFWQYRRIETNNVKAAMEFVPKWLLSEEVQWDPDTEEAIILSPGELYGVSVGYDFNILGAALMEAHKQNATALKLKISDTPLGGAMIPTKKTKKRKKEEKVITLVAEALIHEPS
ncbi:hypothetical protein COCMIDRAFT_8482 [Bipolaris oryzae ATCC 44560]|uniref:Uncharacterized protein n=1 Tax=Bipolaris oryzae ATCC 44560 TaxID=930090 RepID=W6YWC3_COCMI|nr:uncharacterized protein COCMIDRAFT_8482 [Bipolaris oryzae ATCC 44560]EUC41855.1 hypothetical protein COCMIDRAFT_8482 [Bipolaris oryzae ATCC 44560]